MLEKLCKEEILNRIRNSHTAIISLNNGMMTTRNISIMLYDNKIWFQTDLKSKKMNGLNSVDTCECSLLINGLYLDGAFLEIKGHPLDKINNGWLQEFKKYHPNTVKMYSDITTEVLCCIDIKRIDEIRMWEYDENHVPFIHTVKIVKNNDWEDKILNGYTYEAIN